MRKAVNYWESVAKSTVGAIATDKTWWYFIHFDWEDEKWSRCWTIRLHEKDGYEQELKYIQSNLTVEMLGVFLALGENNEEQEMQMKKNCKALRSYSHRSCGDKRIIDSFNFNGNEIYRIWIISFDTFRRRMHTNHVAHS